MKSFFYNVINRGDKQLTKSNTNYFYITSILFIVLTIVYTFVDNEITIISNIDNFGNVNSLIIEILGCNGITHLISNLLLFIVISLVLERHLGSLKYLIVLVFSLFAAEATQQIADLITTYCEFGQVGYKTLYFSLGQSDLVSFLTGICLTLFIFNFKTYFCNKKTFIFTFVILGLIALYMCLDNIDLGNIVETFEFSFFSYLTSNVVHSSCFISGLFIGSVSSIINKIR